MWISVHVQESKDLHQDLLYITLNITEITINYVLFNSIIFQFIVCVFNLLFCCCLHTIILIRWPHCFHCKTRKVVLILWAVYYILHTSLPFLPLLACKGEGMKPVISSGLYSIYSQWFVSCEECANPIMVYQGSAFVKIFF